MTDQTAAPESAPPAPPAPVAETASPAAPPVTNYNPPPINIDDDDAPQYNAHVPALPPLPRPLELRASEGWRAKITEVAGPMGEADPAIGAALAAQATMAEGLAALELARQTRHPSKTVAQHLQAVRDGYNRLLAEGARKRDAAMAALDARERELDREVATRAALTPSADVADIRQALLRMDPEARSKVLGTALANGDTAVLAAVFSGREMTTGVSDITRQSLKRRYEESKVPGLHGMRTGIQEARELAAKSFDELEGLDDKVLGSSKAIDEFQRQVQAADSAWFALSRHTGG